MNDLPLYVWLTAGAVLISWLVAAAALTHILIAYRRLNDIKEYWYHKYHEERTNLERYRRALRNGRAVDA